MNTRLRIASLTTRFALAAGALSFAACSSPPPAAAPSKVQDAEDDERDDGMEMMQEFGGMNEEKVNAVIKKLMPSWEKCLGRGSETNELFGGQFKLLVKVNRSGDAVAALAEESTLGDYSVEQCILEKAKNAHWPKPVGGLIGLVHYGPMSVEPGGRAPVDWDEDRAAKELSSARSELRECGRGSFKVTTYVGTDGRVISAGVAHSEDNGEGAAACIAEKTSKLRFPSPGSWPAKLTFSL